jgi:DNA polymerase (family 10)/putative hydrolase
MKGWEPFRDLLIWGDWHCHTTYTDGRNTVQEMCTKALQNNLKLIAFTDHVRQDLDYDFDLLLRDIDTARKTFPQLKILSGCEAKVLDTEGTLDATTDLLKKCDIVIGSFHLFPFVKKAEYLLAMRNMIRNHHVDIWGHPTANLHAVGIQITSREADSLIGLCKNHKVLVEKNLRYPETDWFADRALELGADVVFSSDAHSTKELRKLRKL